MERNLKTAQSKTVVGVSVEGKSVKVSEFSTNNLSEGDEIIFQLAARIFHTCLLNFLEHIFLLQYFSGLVIFLALSAL